jgi:hypothetical protein
MGKKMSKECYHLYGFRKTDSIGNGIISFLKKEERRYKLDLKFNYCPKCGKS